jgi:hypothetical protein
MVSSNPTRLPSGLSNRLPSELPESLMPVFDPAKHIEYWNDFLIYNAGDWTTTTTEAGAGSATEALTQGQGGALLITNDAADNDNDFLQLVGEAFKFVLGKKTWFKTRIKVSDVTQSDFVIGLQIRLLWLLRMVFISVKMMVIRI